MQDRRFIYASFGGIALMLLPVGCGTTEPEKPPLPALADIEALTEKSCLCEMAGRDATAINRRLAKLTGGLRKEGFDSASVPLSSSVDCYPQLGERACAGRYSVVGGDRLDFVCTNEQADELDRIWTTAGLDADRRTTHADAALRKRLSKIRSELAKRLPQSDCN